MEDRLKGMMHELGNAINESLSESERIAEAIAEIRGAGYDIFLILEATIGFTRRAETERKDTKPARKFGAAGKLKFTSQDARFLKALKIAVEEEPKAK